MLRSLAVGLLAFSIAGCSTSSSQVSEQDRQGGTDTTSSSTSIVSSTSTLPKSDAPTLPLLPFLAESYRFHAALEVLQARAIEACMTDRGFDYAAPPASSRSVPDDTSLIRRRYGAPSATAGGITGYGFDREEGDTVIEPVPSGVDAAVLQQALQGTTVEERTFNDLSGRPLRTSRVGDGCVGQAVVGIFGSADEYFDFVELETRADLLSRDSLVRLWSDERLAPLLAEWSSCLAAAGFDATSPTHMMNRDWPSPRPSPEEELVAKADLQCRAAVAFEDRASAVESAIQLELLEAYPELLTAIADRQRSIIAMASG